MEPDGWPARILSVFRTRMHDPMQLGAFLCGAPADLVRRGVSPARRGDRRDFPAQARAKKHLELARDIELLRDQVKQFKRRLPEDTDSNEWVEYVLTGLRTIRLKLVALDPKATVQHGPFHLVVLRIELEGGFHDLDRLLGWIESNERLFRVESIRIEPYKNGQGDPAHETGRPGDDGLTWRRKSRSATWSPRWS